MRIKIHILRKKHESNYSEKEDFVIFSPNLGELLWTLKMKLREIEILETMTATKLLVITSYKCKGHTREVAKLYYSHIPMYGFVPDIEVAS